MDGLADCAVRIALRQLGWREVRDGEKWDIFWTDTSVGTERVCRLAPGQVCAATKSDCLKTASSALRLEVTEPVQGSNTLRSASCQSWQATEQQAINQRALPSSLTPACWARHLHIIQSV